MSSSIAALETRYSCIGGGRGLFSSHGSTLRCFSQNGVMSQTRSRMTGIDGGASTRVFPSCVNCEILLLHARCACPLIHIAHEPQIALRQEHRTASDSS